ncbi:hypothetical protein EYF80_007685 [Liparis tanakae]|uniref:Uncharacterized protein n=1 Tax=Liparis tanakae TaxID=230148 RepID=A0A4Z2IVK9_9TELE|nr:hypothetical protein EYF80_007685 [Liparis tanakae]
MTQSGRRLRRSAEGTGVGQGSPHCSGCSIDYAEQPSDSKETINSTAVEPRPSLSYEWELVRSTRPGAASGDGCEREQRDEAALPHSDIGPTDYRKDDQQKWRTYRLMRYPYSVKWYCTNINNC